MDNNEEELPHVEDDSIEVGQATLATIGFTNVVKGDMPRVGIGLQHEILSIDKRIDKLAKAFVADELPGKLSVPRPFTYRKMFERFTKPITEAEMTVIMDKFPPNLSEVSLSFQSALNSAYSHVADMVPVSQVATYLGPKNIKPTSDKEFDFWVEYWVIDKPLDAFSLMQRGALLPEQVTTIKEFYPSIYNYMKVSILNALTERKLREPSFTYLPPRADRGLGVFKQMRVVEYGPNVHVVPPNDPKPAEVEPPKLNKGLQSQAQRAGAV